MSPSIRITVRATQYRIMSMSPSIRITVRATQYRIMSPSICTTLRATQYLVAVLSTMLYCLYFITFGYLFNLFQVYKCEMGREGIRRNGTLALVALILECYAYPLLIFIGFNISNIVILSADDQTRYGRSTKPPGFKKAAIRLKYIFYATFAVLTVLFGWVIYVWCCLLRDLRDSNELPVNDMLKTFLGMLFGGILLWPWLIESLESLRPRLLDEMEAMTM